MSIVKLINTTTKEEIQFPTVNLAINHASTLLARPGTTMYWRLSNFGYSDEHWQGYEAHYTANTVLKFIDSGEPQWVVVVE